MKKKGFTLVELLGVFTLIGIVLLLVVPNVTQMLNRAKNDDYDRFINDLFLASEAYIESNQQQIENLRLVGGKSYIKVEDLIYAGYLRSTIINPKTNQKIDPDHTIIACRTASEKVTYQYVEENLTMSGYVQDGLRLHHDSFVKPIDGKWPNLGNVGSVSTLANFSTNNGFRGSQVDFDGTNYISYGPLNYNYISVSAYFLIPEATTGEQLVINNYENGGYGIAYDQSNNNKISFQIYAAGAYQQLPDTEPYQLNTWYHVTGTYDGTTMRLYINGQLKATKAISGTIGVPINNTSLMFATNPTGANATAKYKLSLRSAMVYDRAITESEVKQNYQLDRKRYATGSEEYVQNGLVLQLDGYQKPVNNVWNDLSGNGNHATLSSFGSGTGWMNNKIVMDTGSTLRVEAAESLNLPNKITVEVIMRVGNEFSSYAIHPIQKYESTTNSNFSLYLFGVPDKENPSSEVQKFSVYATVGGSWRQITGYVPFDWNHYYNIAFTYDSNEGGFIYANQQKSSAISTRGTLLANPYSLFMNFASGTTGYELLAVRIYNRVLTEEELKQNYELDRIRFGI